MKYLLLMSLMLGVFVLKAQTELDLSYQANCNLLREERKQTISTAYFKNEQVQKSKEFKKAKRLKITGLIFTGLGSVGILTNTVFVVIYKRAFDPFDFPSSFVGVIGYTPSVACLGIGMPMAIVGSKKMNKAKEAIKTF